MITPYARQKLARLLSSAGQVPALDAGGGTVGAVAIDRDGHVAAATSTGGMLGKRPGRVGDSPLIGSGTYADDQAGAASATGLGESIMRLGLCLHAVTRVQQGEPAERVARAAIERLSLRAGGTGGLILLSPRGELALARSTPHMPWAARWSGGKARGA
jgi:beta-aspartyl-peptidase (threonine type)